MPAVVSRSGTIAERKRRMHSKSRKGCENCKMRRVKCDEKRPCCNKCRAFGVSCDFGGLKADLDVAARGSFQVQFTASLAGDDEDCAQDGIQHDLTGESSDPGIFDIASEVLIATEDYSVTCGLVGPWSPVSANATMTSMIACSLRSGSSNTHADLEMGPVSPSKTPAWEFSEVHLEILNRFQSRTALTVGDKRMAPGYRDIVCQLAFHHPFLMHMLIGLTLMHDADLSLVHSSTLSAKQQHLSLLHWDHATTLFHHILAHPIPPSYRDAIWATSVHLGAASFWYVESSDPTTMWPLKPSEPSDLSWLKIGQGKRHLWRVADPTRKDSVFHHVLKRKPCSAPPEWISSSNSCCDADSPLSEELRRIFSIDETSTIENNGYLLAIRVLERIRHTRLTHANVLHFLYFTAFITPEFTALLEKKDARAIFLLGWWFSVIGGGELWWMARRARVEGEAVRIWLRRTDWGLAYLLDKIRRERKEVLEGGKGLRDGIGAYGQGGGGEVNWALDSRGTILTCG